MYCHMALEVLSAGADVAAVGMQAGVLARRGWRGKIFNIRTSLGFVKISVELIRPTGLIPVCILVSTRVWLLRVKKGRTRWILEPIVSTTRFAMMNTGLTVEV